MKTHALLLLALLLTGCSTVASQSSAPSAELDHDADAGSLFLSDAETMSDTEIARILETRVPFPEQFRVALLYMEHRSDRTMGYRGWEPTREDLMLVEAPAERLLQHPQIADASYLPTFLLSSRRSMGRIREAGARYQSDFVFIFKTRTSTHEKNRVVGKDEILAQCTAEAVLLDVRTGIFVFSARSREEFRVHKTGEHFNWEVAVSEAELGAVESAVAETAKALVVYLDRTS